MRDRRFELTLEQYVRLKTGACHFGGGKSPDILITIDRADSVLGYSEDNCIPCCWKHNVIKGRWFTVEEMFELVKLYPRLKECENRRDKHKEPSGGIILDSFDDM